MSWTLSVRACCDLMMAPDQRQEPEADDGGPTTWSLPPFKRGTHLPTQLMDLPQSILQQIVLQMPYKMLPIFRGTCRLARELVDAASEGWIVKVEEAEALQTSSLLHRLISLSYVFFQHWDLTNPQQQLAFLAVILANHSVFQRLKEVRFPGTPSITFPCLRGLLGAVPSAGSLGLPPLVPAAEPDSVLYLTAMSCIAAVTRLTDLSLDGWALTDSACKSLAGLRSLKRLTTGNASLLTELGYEALAQLTGLTSLWTVNVAGANTTLAPLSRLTELRFVRAELHQQFRDHDLGPLAGLPNLQTLGWWHFELVTPARPWWQPLGANLREISLFVKVDLAVLQHMEVTCKALSSMQAGPWRPA